jgi:formamidopyrimidine-DNA glycosylase
MPELPEVETVRVGLNKLVVKKVIRAVHFDHAKSFPNDSKLVKKFVIGAEVIALRRRAKLLIIDLSSGYSLITHLKMTGQLVFRSSDESFGAGHPTRSLISKLPDKSTRVTLSFNDKSKLFFNDQRKFGWMRLIPTEAIVELDFYKKYGPEPLDKDFSWQILKNRMLRRSKSAVKPVLMDQTVLAGVGNIYADESLWSAKINPLTVVADITDAKFKLLHKSLVGVLKLSIEKGGSTDRNYVNAEGVRGSYIQFANAFRKEGQPCPRGCGTNIIKIRVAGRGTHLCPHCQPAPVK